LTSGQEASQRARTFDLGPQYAKRPIPDFESAL
jgi:hypothetical protein